MRYDNRLKAAEKLFYSEITALTNAKGYCFASNKYFANLYNCDTRTITRWVSNLEKYNYIKIEMVKSENNAIIGRRIYLNYEGVGMDKNVMWGIDKSGEYNNIDINIEQQQQILEKMKYYLKFVNEYNFKECINFSKDFSIELIEKALEKASARDGSWAYARKILKNWKKKKIFTLAEVSIEEENFLNSISKEREKKSKFTNRVQSLTKEEILDLENYYDNL